MKFLLIIFIGLLIALGCIFTDVNEDDMTFDLIYAKNTARLVSQERKAWHFENKMIEDDMGWIWETNKDIDCDEIILITVDGNRVVSWRKLN